MKIDEINEKKNKHNFGVVIAFVSREGQILRRWVGVLEKEVLVRSIKEIM